MLPVRLSFPEPAPLAEFLPGDVAVFPGCRTFTWTRYSVRVPPEYPAKETDTMTMPPTDPADEGMRLLQQGDAAGAVAFLQQAVQNDPSNGVAYQFLGIALSQIGDLAGGIASLEEAARLLPQNAGVQYNLGVALTQAERTEEARAALSKALEIDPNNAKARTALERLPAAPAEPMAPAISDEPRRFAPPTAGPAAPAVPTLGTLGGMAPIGGATPPPVATAPSPAPLSATPSPYGPSLAPPVPVAQSPSPSDAVGGMAYVPPAVVSPQMFSQEPTTGQRILRGLGWGALYGQWWTLWNIVSAMIWGGFSGHSSAILVFTVILMVVVFAFMGAIAGLIIGAINGDEGTGTVVGIVFGLLCFGGEMLLAHSGLAFTSIIFWFFTGRYVGRNIGRRVQERVVV